MPTLGNRIRHIRDEILRLNQASFANMLGFSRAATISDYEKNKRNPDIVTLRKIAKLGSVTLDWLLTGKPPKSILEIVHDEHMEEYVKGTSCDDYCKVPVFDMNMLPGPDSIPGRLPIEMTLVPKKDVTDRMIWLRFSGESMEPTIADGAVLGVDRGEKRLLNGKVYLVWLSYEGVTVKRVFIDPKRIILASDNQSFPKTTMPVKKFDERLIIGRVVWVHQRLR